MILRPPWFARTDTLFAYTTRFLSPDPALSQACIETCGRMCMGCHGQDALAGGSAPDLRGSGVIVSPEAFASVVRDGALLPNGMPRFQSFADRTLAESRHSLRGQAHMLSEQQKSGGGSDSGKGRAAGA